MRQLTPGAGDFYEIRIDAVADPTPPILEPTDEPPPSIEREFNSLVRSMEELSAREAMDQVHRRLTIHLCLNCYRQWIENPAGS